MLLSDHFDDYAAQQSAIDLICDMQHSDQVRSPLSEKLPVFTLSYSRTSRKRPPIMSRICGRSREVVAYQRSDHRKSNFREIYIW